MGANAQTSVPAFTAGQVLTAQQQTEINTGIPVFATTTTRDAAFGGTGEKTLAEGQFAYIEATNTTQFYDGTSWLSVGGKIGQIVSATRSTLFTSSSTSYVDVTTMTATITPTATSSKILVWFTSAGIGANGTADVLGRFMRDSTSICETAFVSSVITASNESRSPTVFYLDSPNSTSAIVYKLQARTTNNAFSVGGRYDGSYTGVSSFMVMEVLA